jgi:hypothetical protein
MHSMSAILTIAIGVPLALVIYSILPIPIVESSPAWADGLYNYLLPALIGLSEFPILDTLISILFWLAVFEFAFFLLKLTLRVLAWLKITGASWVE